MKKQLRCTALVATLLTLALPVIAGPAPGYMDFMRPGRKPVLPPAAPAPAAPATESEQKATAKAPAPAAEQKSAEKSAEKVPPATTPDSKPVPKSHASASGAKPAPAYKLVTSGPPKNSSTHLVYLDAVPAKSSTAPAN